ncbi:acetoin utilization protein [Rhodobacter veldkampii DSM 11550]|uniref:Acetoin utilization protein n=1 Tax=Phaeovulum veldkampii DSM 11550 TaxID=1185920 RepID=A0A2T4JL78_9RHOB|nr:histone deacetylase family protein [Phaeovulum veldkampii]MBK5947040.1 acetoin utilization protein [Phaeovulum veldkampii DSM 11550]PTE18656.1 acetoin utilization protein [Phaeovulum veldkampii DSM 11550]TDQ57287.1 acetoin utilization deacetylase AcuC-like enzyme [Phaeovulum veldkampii DSM 11550]
MATAFFTHPAGLAHLVPPGHPEGPARLVAVHAALADWRFSALIRHEAPRAPRSEVLRGHSPRYLTAIDHALPAAGFAQLDGDTFLSPGTVEAALRAAGGVCAAVDAVLAGEAVNAFVAMRPPGHHAEAERAMGFCLFNAVAIGARRALDHHGLARVAVLDFDVHHGNGTQAIMWDEPRAFFGSSHQMPLYPGTGAAGETGAHGQIMNAPLPAGSGGAEMRAAWARILARAHTFAPDLILISAGFDAHCADPLAGLMWQTDDYRWLTEAICDLAWSCCRGHIVSTLEGGYDLESLAACAAAHVAVLMERGE